MTDGLLSCVPGLEPEPHTKLGEQHEVALGTRRARAGSWGAALLEAALIQRVTVQCPACEKNWATDAGERLTGLLKVWDGTSREMRIS